IGVPLRSAVLTHAFWQSHFDGQARVVGREIELNGDRFTVVGVGPSGFQGSTVLAPDIWVPLTSYARGMVSDETLRGRVNNQLIMGARLEPGVSVGEAQASLDAFAADLAREHPDVYREFGLLAVPASRLPGFGRAYVAPFLGLLFGVTGLVLLVTCANLAGLLLARAAGRTREMAVRLALGASRRTLVAMLMTETLLVFAAGALAALLVGWWTTGALRALVGIVPVPLQVDLSMDWRVFAFTAAIAFVASCVTGLLPALQSARADVVTDLKSDAAAPRRQRMRQVFITAQLSACLVLIVVAGLFARALGTAGTIPAGFDVDGVEVATVDLAIGGYALDRGPAVAGEIARGLAAIPGVERVGYARMVPLSGGGLGLGALRKPGTGPEESIRTDWNVVSPEFFATIGLPIRRGRAFDATDVAGAPMAAIVSERLAAEAWPGDNPIGKTLENGDFRPGREDSIRTLTVVGVAADAKYRWIGEGPAPFIYVAYAQEPTREVNFFLRRAVGSTAPLQPGVRAALTAFDRNLPLVTMQPLTAYADFGLVPQRLAASVAGSLGLLALLLAGMGLYGVTAFAVASRTREIGVRMALGADRATVVRLVVWQAARVVGIGSAIGLVLAVGASQLVATLLFGISPLDPITYGATLAALAAITVIATALPARRAATVDPLRALRAE
ncbi:MAG TPA: ADOP family duplicated permease, partial [Vicinamibacterales bacterium]|nr:ADOP family duplicated permease [Vicinamibacterales bacterium]